MDLWITGNGRITCTDHSGNYLAASVKASPRARIHDTPLDHFEKVTREMREELAATEFPAECESCAETSARTGRIAV